MSSRLAVNVPLLLVQLFKAEVPYLVTVEPNDKDLNKPPLAIVESTSPAPVINGPYGAATRFTANITLIASSRLVAMDEADKLYRIALGLRGKSAPAGQIVRIDVATEPDEVRTSSGPSGLYQYRFPATGIARKV